MVCNYAMWYAIIKWSQLRKRSIHCLKLRMQMFNPFRIAKAASNGNHRLCLKSKPQVKCHWSLPAGSTSVSEARTPRPALNFGHRTGPPPHPGRAIRKGPNKAIHKINRKWSTPLPPQQIPQHNTSCIPPRPNHTHKGKVQDQFNARICKNRILATSPWSPRHALTRNSWYAPH